MKGPSCEADASITNAPMASRPTTIGIRNHARRWIRKWNNSPIVRTSPKVLPPRSTRSCAAEVYKSHHMSARSGRNDGLHHDGIFTNRQGYDDLTRRVPRFVSRPIPRTLPGWHLWLQDRHGQLVGVQICAGYPLDVGGRHRVDATEVRRQRLVGAQCVAICQFFRKVDAALTVQ
jgi:hypothetical protein